MKSRQGRERWRKLVESKYNSWYRVFKEEGEPEYLKKMKKERKWKRMVRCRMGEGVRECRYWMEEEENECRVRRYERESWAHVLERCTGDEERGPEIGG